MQINLKLDNNELKEMIRESVKEELISILKSNKGLEEIRNGTREYLLGFSLLEFVNLIKK